jgi:hypothetical protein
MTEDELTEDELTEKMARALVRLELSAQRNSFGRSDFLDFMVEKLWHDRAPNARAALAAIREAVGDPLTLIAHIRKLEAMNEDLLEQLATRSESGMAKDMQEIMKANNALHDENARLKQLVDLAVAERAAQKATATAPASGCYRTCRPQASMGTHDAV